MKAVGIIFLLAGLCGCQSSPKAASCSQIDWFELGRRDGTMGQPEQLDEQRRGCGKHFDGLSENLYRNGYNKGLAEYCSPTNGYDLGRNGVRPTLVCPAPTDVEFMAAVERGARARGLDETIRQLDREISSINRELSQSDPQNRNRLLAKLTDLKQERADFERKMTQIER